MTDPLPTRQRILAAAVALIGRAGMGGLSAAALARAAGVSKATVFHHFGSMDEIPHQAMELMAEGMVAALPEAEAGLAGFIAAFGETMRNQLGPQGDFSRAYFAFTAHALHDPQLQARCRAALMPSVEAMAGRLTTWLQPERARHLAFHLFALIDGALLHAMIMGESPLLEAAAWARLADDLERTYLPPKTEPPQ